MTDDATSIVDGLRCLLLDFDGPICSVFAGWPAAEVAAWMRSGLHARGHDLEARAIAAGDPMEVLAIVATQSQAAASVAEELLATAERRCVETATPTPGSDELLRVAEMAGIECLIVSNNSEPAIRLYLRSHGIGHLVGHVIGRDPARPQDMKPSPVLLKRALRKVDWFDRRKSLFVGDSVTDVTAGIAANVPVVGYANKPGKAELLKTAGASVVIEGLDVLIEEIRPDPDEAIGAILHAIHMIGAMPKHIANSSLDGDLRAACIESFYVNVRLLSEFLIKTDSRDFKPTLWVPGWNPMESAVLTEIFDLASQHVVHFSRDRMPGGQEVEPVTAEEMRQHAGVTLGAFGRFVEQIPKDTTSYSVRASMTNALDSARNALAAAP